MLGFCEAARDSRAGNGDGSVRHFCCMCHPCHAWAMSGRNAMLGYFRGCMGRALLVVGQFWLSVRLLCRGKMAAARP